MTEIFEPRANMNQYNNLSRYECRNESRQFVCEGGPSIIWDDGYWEFYTNINGHHRLDGPATSDGDWFIRGKNVTEEIRAFAKENNINLNNLSDEEKILIALKFG